MAIEIKSDPIEEVPGLDFNITASDGRKMTITLPVLGAKNVPTGVMALVGQMADARNLGEQDRLRALFQLLETIRSVWPEQGRVLWSLDFHAALQVFEAWFSASQDQGDFDPKA